MLFKETAEGIGSMALPAILLKAELSDRPGLGLLNPAPPRIEDTRTLKCRFVDQIVD